MYSARKIAGVSLGRSLISYLINVYRKVLGSFYECLYWFGSRCWCYRGNESF
uniref:Uncharacterized protein n=1 Tax=Acinetobacter phage vB_Ab_1137_KEN_03 TaxID=3158853 RepID=A0AAU8KVN3_9CAUD